MLKKNSNDTTYALTNNEDTHPRLDSTPKKAGKRTTEEKHNFDVYVGKRLHVLRQISGDSQNSAGGNINVTFQQVQKYEKGFNGLSLYRAYQLSKHYKVPLSYFIDGFDEPENAGENNNLMPMENRGCTKIAHLFNEIPSPRVQKAILGVLHSLVAEKPEAT